MSWQDKTQRSILPIPDPQYVGLTTYDAKNPDTKFPPIEPLRPPKGAPNVLIVLIDDCGFGASSAFGSPIATPNAERWAKNGLEFNRFHTTALCSPTRQALGGSPVSPDYGPHGNQFSGKINWVQIDLEKADQDHLISPAEPFTIAMARQ